MQVFQFEEHLVYRISGGRYELNDLLAMMESLIKNPESLERSHLHTSGPLALELMSTIIFII